MYKLQNKVYRKNGTVFGYVLEDEKGTTTDILASQLVKMYKGVNGQKPIEVKGLSREQIFIDCCRAWKLVAVDGDYYTIANEATGEQKAVLKDKLVEGIMDDQLIVLNCFLRKLKNGKVSIVCKEINKVLYSNKQKGIVLDDKRTQASYVIHNMRKAHIAWRCGNAKTPWLLLEGTIYYNEEQCEICANFNDASNFVYFEDDGTGMLAYNKGKELVKAQREQLRNGQPMKVESDGNTNIVSYENLDTLSNWSMTFRAKLIHKEDTLDMVHFVGNIGDFWFNPREYNLYVSCGPTEEILPFGLCYCGTAKKVRMPDSLYGLQFAYNMFAFRAGGVEEGITEVDNLPKTLVDCANMFYHCIDLKRVGEIPIGVKNCSSMFKGCMVLKEVPAIPKGVLNCFRMFSYCRSLKNAPEIPEGVICCSEMFKGCSALIILPVIPKSVTLYTDMFEGCSSKVKMVGSWNLQHRGMQYTNFYEPD